MSDTITAPFTVEQVDSLNHYQGLDCFYPFTCANDHPEDVSLVATTNGWVCPDPDCSYWQDWAYAWMARDWSTCPEDPRRLRGQPIGMYHCRICGCMVLAGIEHTPHDEGCMLGLDQPDGPGA